MQYSTTSNVLAISMILSYLVLFALVKMSLLQLLFLVTVIGIFSCSAPAVEVTEEEIPEASFIGAYLATSELNDFVKTSISSSSMQSFNDDSVSDDDESVTFYDAEDYQETVCLAEDENGANIKIGGPEKRAEVEYFEENASTDAPWEFGDGGIDMKITEQEFFTDVHGIATPQREDEDMMITSSPSLGRTLSRKISVGWVVLGFKLSLKTIYELDESVNIGSNNSLKYDGDTSVYDDEKADILCMRRPSTARGVYEYEGDEDGEDFGEVIHSGRAQAESALGYYYSDCSTDSDGGGCDEEANETKEANTSRLTIRSDHLSPTPSVDSDPSCSTPRSLALPKDTSSTAPSLGSGDDSATKDRVPPGLRSMKKSSPVRNFFSKAKRSFSRSTVIQDNSASKSGLTPTRKVPSWKRFAF